MPERLSTTEHAASAEVTAMQSEIQTESSTARAELASECMEAHNHIPETRLCWLCAVSGLSLGEQDPAELLTADPYLQRAFARPLPMQDRIRSGCLERLSGLLGSNDALLRRQPSAKVAERQARLAEVKSEQQSLSDKLKRFQLT